MTFDPCINAPSLAQSEYRTCRAIGQQKSTSSVHFYFAIGGASWPSVGTPIAFTRTRARLLTESARSNYFPGGCRFLLTGFVARAIVVLSTRHQPSWFAALFTERQSDVT
jgi:hypothetical protein